MQAGDWGRRGEGNGFTGHRGYGYNNFYYNPYYYSPVVYGYYYQRPYPYHFDYYRYRWGQPPAHDGGYSPEPIAAANDCPGADPPPVEGVQ
jgi:hypothetical protein